MSDRATTPEGALPRWLPWVFVVLLVLPFHPLWVDFEQVRRGLLLVGAGAVLAALHRLPAARGERTVWWFAGFLFASACINLGAQLIAQTEDKPISFQSWDAVYRIAQVLALIAMLRLGAAGPTAFATPIAAALLTTSSFGVLQHLGLAAIGSYGTAREPVSVFGNLNVASECTAVLAAATAVLGSRPAWLWSAALATASVYLVVNQSRSGLVALPLGLLLLLVLRRREQGWLAPAIGAGGAALGALLWLGCPRPEPVDLSAVAAEQKRGTVTLGVRLEIAKGSARLLGESPLFGLGPGQFAVQYPRVRSQDEIEASSHGRKFASEVRTAHDDWIEILVEGGLPGLVLFALFLFALQRGATERVRQVPLFVLLLLMLVRSPLGNAPAVAIALLLVGRPDEGAAPGPARRWTDRVLGITLFALGLLPIVGNTVATAYLAARARGDHPPRDALASASWWMPFEPRWLQLLGQEQMMAGDLAAAATTAARALQLRPFDPQAYVLLGEILARGNRVDEADRIARHALAFDPANPELRVLLSTMRARQKDPDAAIAAVVLQPHPVLRAQLREHFRALAKLAERAGDDAGACRYRVERAFLQAVDALGGADPAAWTAAQEHVKALLTELRTAGIDRTDLRGHAVTSRHALDIGDPDLAIQQGEAAAKLGIPMPPWQRDLFGDKLDLLQTVEAWHAVLARR